MALVYMCFSYLLIILFLFSFTLIKNIVLWYFYVLLLYARLLWKRLFFRNVNVCLLTFKIEVNMPINVIIIIIINNDNNNNNNRHNNNNNNKCRILYFQIITDNMTFSLRLAAIAAMVGLVVMSPAPDVSKKDDTAEKRDSK